ncbi:MAG: RHS repeat-associated core domain-containing protein [Blastocatellia bacterium]|nr:RHS repeat-associated core domain-containing protein [Blastocatellia bacterium]
MEFKSANETISGSQTWKQTFTFDRYGNRKFDQNQTTTLGNCPANVCNPDINPANNRVIGHQFDNAGNTTLDAEGKQFFYDAENKQKEVKNANGQVIGQYLYDGDGKRVKKLAANDTTIFVYDAGGKLASEYTVSASQSQAPQTSYLTNDTLGSPRVTTDSSGNVVSRRDFRPYGEEIARVNQGQDSIREKFATYERDNETELDFAQARMYSSKLGRFTTVDPINLTADRLSDPQQLNLYVYVRNNPMVFVDPNGEDLHIAIGAKPVGTTTIRIIGSSGDQPKTMEVNVYKMNVYDDTSKVTTTYYVTRDAPMMDSKNPVNEVSRLGSLLGYEKTYNVNNTAFEPKENVGEYVGLALKYPAGTDLEAIALRTKEGSEALPAEYNDKADRKNPNVATGIMIHVGGVYQREDGSSRITGSKGCFGTCDLKTGNGGNNTQKAFIKDITDRQELAKKMGEGTKIRVYIYKRQNVPKSWELNSKGEEQ